MVMEHSSHASMQGDVSEFMGARESESALVLKDAFVDQDLAILGEGRAENICSQIGKVSEAETEG